MRDWYLGAWRSVARTISFTLKFDGRSRAMDVVYYWLASMLAAFLVSFPLALLPWDAEWFARSATDIILALPFIALFARRMHDHGLSGWLSLALLPFPAINLYQSYRAVLAVRNPSWLAEPDPLRGWFPWLLVVMIVIFVAALLPGRRGPNRYGPDPRGTVVG